MPTTGPAPTTAWFFPDATPDMGVAWRAAADAGRICRRFQFFFTELKKVKINSQIKINAQEIKIYISISIFATSTRSIHSSASH